MKDRLPAQMLRGLCSFPARFPGITALICAVQSQAGFWAKTGTAQRIPFPEGLSHSTDRDPGVGQ